MRTAVTDLLGIEVPIFAFSHCRDVVAAVSKAGGLGVLGAVAHTPEQLEIDLRLDRGRDRRPALRRRPDRARQVRRRRGRRLHARRHPRAHPGRAGSSSTTSSAATRCPSSPPTTTPARATAVSATTATPRSRPTRPARSSRSRSAHRTAFVANALGPPPQFLIDRVKEEGRLDRRARRQGRARRAPRAAGVDIIIAQGSEAGGHTGEIGSMVLIPEVVDAVAPVPVLGAGGIGRGRQMAAAMALGAQGVWCGSVWLTTDEAETHPGGQGEDARRDVGRHAALAVAHRQAGPHAAVGVDRRVGARRHARPARHAAAADPHRRRAAADRPGRLHEGIRCREAGQLLRGPDRRHDEPAQEARPRSSTTWSTSSSKRSSRWRRSSSTENVRRGLSPADILSGRCRMATG